MRNIGIPVEFDGERRRIRAMSHVIRSCVSSGFIGRCEHD